MDTMMIAIIVIAVLACSIIIFVILSLFSPRVQGKMMSKQIKSVKHMMDYSKDDLKELMKITAKTGTIAEKEILDENEDIMSNNERRKANIKKEGIEVTARAIKNGLTSNKIYCRYCGASIESDSRFCKNCGKEQ